MSAADNDVPARPAPAGESSRPGGIIALFARHRSAPNLLLAVMVIAGCYGIFKLNAQFLPDFGLDFVNVRVEWPGATANDVDARVVQAIVPELRFLDSVKRVKAAAYPGSANVNVEFRAGSDMQAALSDVEAAMSRIRTLPADSKTPETRRVQRYETILRVVLSGPFSETSLKAHAKRLRDGLLGRGIDRVDLVGARDEEILVEVPSAALRRLDVTLADIGARIRETSQDLPSGDVAAGNMQVRSLGLETTARGFGGIEIKALNDGRTVHLHDIARVREGFEDGGVEVRRNGQRAIELHVRRAVSSDALKASRIAETYLDGIASSLPQTLEVGRYDVATGLLQDRIDLLIKNGASGLLIVILVLLVFLRARVAFWVLVGIPASLLATFGVMLATGQSVNMISLFGLIMTLGIIVDDSIVVGEHVDTQSRLGLTPLAAAVSGAQSMTVPVISAALTTIAAFLPLFVVSGVIGQIIAAIPMVVVAVLIASLIECFLVLPGHLTGAFASPDDSSGWVLGRFQRWFDGRFTAFRDGPFRHFVEVCVAWRYVTVSVALGLLVVAAGMVAGGRVGYNFFPTPEADQVYANVQMVPGSPRETLEAMLDELDRALHATARKLEGEGTGLVRMSVAKVGLGTGSAVGAQTENLGVLAVELRTADERNIGAAALIEAWRDEVSPRAGLDTLTIHEARGGPPGLDVDVRLIGADTVALKRASQELQDLLGRYPGVSAIEDDLPYGKRETILEVTERGRSMGFTTHSVGRQVRNAIEGAIATRFVRADEEVAVRVKLPEEELGTDILDRLYLRGPSGSEVPLAEVVSRRGRQGFARISREDGRHEVAVTAKLDTAITSTGEVLEAMRRDGLWRIADRAGVEVAFKGRSEESGVALTDMSIGALMGIAGIYIILAWAFASYTRPLVVMGIIPMGFVGAVFGHWLLGFDLSILSLVALVGLAGIVVNNSIILVTTIERHAATKVRMEAIVGGVCDRLRAVTLTSATTMGGLSPLLFETSLQAQFLIPMALTIIFGLACASLLVLFVVPSLVAIQGDLNRFSKRLAAMPLQTRSTQSANVQTSGR